MTAVESFTPREIEELELHLDDGTEWETASEFWEVWGPRISDRLRRLLATAKMGGRATPAEDYTSPFWVERRLLRDQRQAMLVNWAELAFGRMEASSVPQRGVRLLEEAIEAFQACGGDEAIAHKLVAFVFSRPAGTVGQELGGVAVTTLLLAAAAGLSADEEECREMHRVLSKPLREFTERNANKNAAGFRIARCSWAGCSTPDNCDGTKHIGPEKLRGNSCCGNTGSHREGGREYCSTCGQELP